ncbi:MAG: PEP-CTERM sorting domain-containing protein [Bryobacteraceae bacterium]
MKKLACLLVIASVASALSIDDFTSDQSACDGGACGGTASSSTLNTGVLGGNRDLVATLLSISGQVRMDSNAIEPGRLTFSASDNAIGVGVAQWDGPEGTAAIDSTGLGGVDLLADGALFFAFVARADHVGDVEIVVYDQATGTPHSVLVNLPGDNVDHLYLVPFSDFGAATLNNVGAVEILISGVVTGLDVELDFLGTSGVPEPATWMTLGASLIALGLARRRKFRI